MAILEAVAPDARFRGSVRPIGPPNRVTRRFKQDVNLVEDSCQSAVTR
jgi:hypothetical protein